jgi:transcription elongation factor GreA
MTTKLLTPVGKKKLEDELEGLKKKRIVIAQKIKEAKELGDLSENAEYHAAKEEQGAVESRVNEIESLLRSATLVKPTSSKSRISVGSKIKVKSDGEMFDYEIVGTNEADPGEGKISANSPLGAAFLGKKKSDSVVVNVPMGKLQFEIIDIY